MTLSVCLSSLARSCPSSSWTWFRGLCPSPHPSAGLSLTWAALAAAKKQVRLKTSSRRPMLCACLCVALSLACGYLWGSREPAWVGSCLLSVLFPLTCFCPFLQAGCTPGSIPCCFQMGSGWPRLSMCGRVHAHTRAHSHTCRDVPSFPGPADPGALVPQCTCAGYCLPGNRGRWPRVGAARAGAWLGAGCPAFWLIYLQGLGSSSE